MINISLIFYVIKGNVYIRNFCCTPMYNSCLEKKHLCNYLSGEQDESFLLWAPFFNLKKLIANYTYSDLSIWQVIFSNL